jgi:hypothetical protein
MTEPSPSRPVPGPPRAVPGPQQEGPTPERTAAGAPFADLDERPVGEHVGVFEAEHSRLERELGTIDQL